MQTELHSIPSLEKYRGWRSSVGLVVGDQEQTAPLPPTRILRISDLTIRRQFVVLTSAPV